MNLACQAVYLIDRCFWVDANSFQKLIRYRALFSPWLISRPHLTLRADFESEGDRRSSFNWKGKFTDFREGDVQNPLINYLLIEFKKVHLHWKIINSSGGRNVARSSVYTQLQWPRTRATTHNYAHMTPIRRLSKLSRPLRTSSSCSVHWSVTR